MATIIMAGGGTGGHVIPALAVARELVVRGHRPVFIGTRGGFEAKLVPSAGFPLEFIEIGGLKRVGLAQTMRTFLQLPKGVWKALRVFKSYRPGAVFSMGGYVAGPVVLAALLKGLPIVAMEPNATPGLTNRQIGRFVSMALIGFPETAKYFPKGRSEVTGRPIRAEFFSIRPKTRGEKLTILITGGSQGSRTLNRAARESWSLFRDAPFGVRFIHQAGVDAREALALEFADSGLEGEIVPFIDDMPRAFAEADLIVCRSGGTVAELAAAGKPSILVPFPFAADDHQLRNAEAFAKAGAARLVLDREMNGRRLFDEVSQLVSQLGDLERMGRQARTFAHPDAARRAAEIVEGVIRA
jgi:UDP-N-acetylglucosamine--N-acetylmuramyl-(pentapeptide) pyrophosphoryl-undecaprenol N-acetylglucosamine transferase